MMVLHSGKNKIAKRCVSPSRPSVRLLSLGVPGEVPLDLLLLHAHQLQHGPQLPLLEALLLPAAGGGGCRQPPPLELFPPPPRPRASLRSWLVLVVISCPGRNVLRIRSVGTGAATRHLLQTPASQATETEDISCSLSGGGWRWLIPAGTGAHSGSSPRPRSCLITQTFVNR